MMRSSGSSSRSRSCSMSAAVRAAAVADATAATATPDLRMGFAEGGGSKKPPGRGLEERLLPPPGLERGVVEGDGRGEGGS